MSKYGFTLLETLLVNAIIVVVLVAVSLIWRTVMTNYNSSLAHYQVQEDVSSAIRQIETELRQAEEGMQGAYPLSIMEDYQLAFYADIDNNGLIERVRYWTLDGKLFRGVTQPSGNPPQYDLTTEKSRQIAQNIDVRSPLFTYYNSDWPQDTTSNPLSLAQRPLQARLVKITIPIVMNTDSATASLSAETTVQIRNLTHDL